MAAVLFDLDMTLVDSSSVAKYRDLRMWRQVMSNLHRVRGFDTGTNPCPHELPARLKKLGFSVGVVTNSIRKYAEEVLDQFGIPYDVLVAYHDTKRHKPDPEPIEYALDELDCDPADAFYVGDRPDDVAAAYHAGVVSIGVTWGLQERTDLASTAPDILVSDPRTILKHDDLLSYRFVGDMYPDKPVFHKHSVLWFAEGTPGFALGRYFVTGDPRHAETDHSKQILNLKGDDAPAARFAKMLAWAIKKWKLADQFPFLVPVPPKPERRDKFAALLEDLEGRLGDTISIDPDGLTCRRDTGNLKSMKYADRQSSVRGAFQTKYDWDGNGILLLDDVLTTGATSTECIRVLRRKNAGKIMRVVLGKDQVSFAGVECPECGEKLVVRTNSKTGERFWGCRGYPDCKFTAKI